MPLALIGLGSNFGQRYELLCGVVTALQREAVELIACSRVYETQPWEAPDSVPSYLNAVVLVQTELSAEQLWAFCMELEVRFGRQRGVGARLIRSIDMDLLLYEQVILRTEYLCLPHPLMHRRRFVLVPAVEIAGDYRHPLLRRTLRQLLAECPDPGWVRPYGRLFPEESACRSQSGS